MQEGRFYKEIVDRVATGLMVLDPHGEVQYANQAARRILGTGAIGMHFAALFDERERCDAFLGEIARSRGREGAMVFAGDIVRHDKTVLRLEVQAVNFLETPDLNGIVLSIFDVTARYGLEQELIAKATVDGLTGLANRTIFLDRTRSALRSGVKGSVAYGDLDLFKDINDRHGHAVGDTVLQVVARRLVDSVPDTVTVARLGGDEFGLLLPNLSPQQAQQTLHQSLVQVAQPISVGAATITPSLSVGIASIEGQSAQKTLKDCDMAMYAAKARGRNQIVVFGDDVRKAADGRRELTVTVLRLSSENQELHSQARTDSLTGLLNRRALLDVEALVLASDACAWTQAAMLFVDIDHFGKYNHLYGDSGGDVALRSVAKTLAAEARDTDLVFRKGGEEFVVLLPNSGLPSAISAAQRIRCAIEGLEIAHADSEVSSVLTVTVGVGWGGAGELLGGLLSKASDRAMAAKLHGKRNAVHSGLQGE